MTIRSGRRSLFSKKWVVEEGGRPIGSSHYNTYEIHELRISYEEAR